MISNKNIYLIFIRNDISSYQGKEVRQITLFYFILQEMIITKSRLKRMMSGLESFRVQDHSLEMNPTKLRKTISKENMRIPKRKQSTKMILPPMITMQIFQLQTQVLPTHQTRSQSLVTYKAQLHNFSFFIEYINVILKYIYQNIMNPA